MLPILVFVLALIIFIGFIIENHRISSKLPKGPVGIPFLGYLPFLNLNNVPDSLMKLSEVYGDIFSIKIGMRTVIVLSSYKAMKSAFSNVELCGRQKSKLLYPSGESGLVGANGVHWREQRRFVLHGLKNLGAGRIEMEEMIVDDVQILLNNMKEKIKEKKPINISHFMNLASVSALWSIIAGERKAHDDPLFTKMINSLEETFKEYFIAAGLAIYFPQIVRWIPTKWIMGKNYQESVAMIREAAEISVKKHKETINYDEPRDFVDLYLTELKKGTKNGGIQMSEYELTIILVDLFIGGVETTGTTLKWSMMFMAKHQDIQKKVQKEIDEVIGQNRYVSYMDKFNLPYCEAVIAEIQRESSLVPIGVPHTAEEDTKFKDYLIPKGTVLFSNIYASHHDPKVWAHPDQFYPEHFLDANGKFVGNKDGFAAFSAGKRSCLGESTARIELFLFFVSLLQHFHISFPNGVIPDMTPKDISVVRRCPHYEVILENRFNHDTGSGRRLSENKTIL